jgi:hypothetical protein
VAEEEEWVKVNFPLENEPGKRGKGKVERLS